MKWFNILKNRGWGSLKPQTKDVESEKEPLEVPKAKAGKNQPTIDTYLPSKKKKTPSYKTPKSQQDGGPVGEDTKLNLKELRSQLMRESRGHYSALADEVTRLSAKAREDPRKQKYYLGRVRRILRQAQIPEVKRT